MKKHILLLICFLQCAINYGTDFNVTATPNIVRLGEPIILTIQGPNLTQLQLPDLTPFQITSDSQESTRRSVTLRSYQLGALYSHS